MESPRTGKKPVSTVDQGHRLVVGFLSAQSGKKIASIFDRKGRVFCPNPYDIPQDPYKVAMFSIWMLQAMLDTGRIDEEYFQTKEDCSKFRELLTELHNMVPMLAKIQIEEQPPPSVI